MIRHHPSAATLLAYAAGTLPALHGRVVAQHAACCAACRADIALLEAAGGALLDALPPGPLDPHALERALAGLDRPAPATDPVRPSSPATLDALATGRWRWRGPGIHMMPLARRDASGTRLDLIRVAADTAILEHGHTGLETTQVLQGAFHDDLGDYHVGDFIEADGALAHRPQALPGPACICLIATSGHLSARGPLGHLVRPLLGM